VPGIFLINPHTYKYCKVRKSERKKLSLWNKLFYFIVTALMPFSIIDHMAPSCSKNRKHAILCFKVIETVMYTQVV